MTQTYWQRQIAPFAVGYDPRHVEAYIRLAHSTLGEMSERQFKREIRIAKDCIDQGGREAAERCAQSFGF